MRKTTDLPLSLFYTFAAETNAVPVTIIECAQVMRFYPIVFADGGNFPVAVLGLGQGNRFVTDGVMLITFIILAWLDHV